MEKVKIKIEIEIAKKWSAKFGKIWSKFLAISSLRATSPNFGGGLGLDLDNLCWLKISIEKGENEKNC